MRIILLAVSIGLATPAVADPVTIKGTYGFDIMKPQKSKCTKIDGALLAKLKKSYQCSAPEDPKASASGKTMIANCKTKKEDSIYMTFATAADCREERETQLANGP